MLIRLVLCGTSPTRFLSMEVVKTLLFCRKRTAEQDCFPKASCAGPSGPEDELFGDRVVQTYEETSPLLKARLPKVINFLGSGSRQPEILSLRAVLTRRPWTGNVVEVKSHHVCVQFRQDRHVLEVDSSGQTDGFGSSGVSMCAHCAYVWRTCVVAAKGNWHGQNIDKTTIIRDAVTWWCLTWFLGGFILGGNSHIGNFTTLTSLLKDRSLISYRCLKLCMIQRRP